MTVKGRLPRPDGEIYYEVTGHGPAIIFAHGLGGNYLSWWQQIPFFSKRFTCVAYSQRGFWPSNESAGEIGTALFTDDLAALIDHLRLEEVILVAQSMGGWSCLDYALGHPDRVRSLVMSSTTGAVNLNKFTPLEDGLISEWGKNAELQRKQLEGDGILAATGRRMAVEQPALYHLYFAFNNLTPVVYREAVRSKIRSERTADPETVKQLNMPVLFIIGQEDVVFPSPAARALSMLIDGSAVHQVEEAGHSVYFERADRYNAVVNEFLTAL